MAKTKAQAEQSVLTKKEVAKYGAGGIAMTMGDTMKGTFGLSFLSDVAGVSVNTAGVIMMFMTIWDAINDPIIGRLTDKTETRWGKYRPHLMMSGIGISIMLVAIFIVPPVSPAAKPVYYGIAMALYSVFFTQGVVPLQALNTMVTPSSNERNILLSARQFTGFISGAIVTIIAIPMVTAVGGSERSVKGWAAVAAVVGVFTIVTAFVCADSVKRFDYAGSLPTPPPLRIREQVDVLLKNRAVLCICGAFGMISLGFALNSAISVYYSRVVANDISIVSKQSVFTLLATLVVIPLMPAAIKKFDKIPMLVTGVLISALPAVALVFLGTGATSVQIITLGTIYAVGFSIANLTCLAMVPDVVDYTSVKYNSTQAGLISAVVNFFRKFFASFSTFIVGLMLGRANYHPDVAATPEVIGKIMSVKIVFPLIIMALCLIMIILYPISAKDQVEIRKQLQERKTETDKQ